MAKEVRNHRELRTPNKAMRSSRSNTMSKGATEDMKDRLRILTEDNEIKQ